MCTLNKIYVNKTDIVSVEIYDKCLKYELFHHKIKAQTFLGFKIKQEKEFYQTTPKYDKEYNEYKTINEAFHYLCPPVVQDDYMICNDKIYLKPRVIIKLKDKRTITKYFDNKEERDIYIKTLNLNMEKFLSINDD